MFSVVVPIVSEADRREQMNEEASNEVDERYGAFRIADGRFVIYDTNTPTAWVMADTGTQVTP